MVGRSLLEYLPVAAPALRVVALVPPGCGYEDVCRRSGAKYEVVRVRRPAKIGRVLLDNFDVPAAAKRHHADVVLSLANSGPLFLDRPHLLVLQSAFLAFGTKGIPGWNWRDKTNLWVQQRLFRLAAKRADLVLPQTHTVERELVRRRFVEPGKTRVIPNGANSYEGRRDIPAAMGLALSRAAGRLKLLFIAHYYPHKNFEYLVDVAAALPPHVRQRVAFVLTVDRGQHRLASQTLDRIRDCNLSELVLNVGPVPPDALAPLYATTDGVFFPSLLESYSGSYLEAMQFGKPILTSDRDFAREPCGTAPLYFDPRDVSSGVAAVTRFVTEPGLRDDLAKASRARLADLPTSTWRDVAVEYASAIVDVCNSAYARRREIRRQ